MAKDPCSHCETRKHVDRVRTLIDTIVVKLLIQGAEHDASKLEDPEVVVFEEFTKKLKGTTYGSVEYKGYLEAMKPALDHHYANNRHHPEHFPDGIRGMTLLDVVEMLCDWKAASERHNDGNILTSIEKNAERFDIPPVLAQILVNTVKALALLE